MTITQTVSYPIKFIVERPNPNTFIVRLEPHHWQLDIQLSANQLTVQRWLGQSDNVRLSYQILDQLIANTDATQITLSHEVINESAGKTPSQVINLRHWQLSEQGFSIQRAAFYQLREIWLDERLLSITPDIREAKEGVAQPVPVRPALPEGVLYRRQIPALNQVFELRRASVEADGERFHRWQNDARVAAFWEYPFSREKLDQYLTNCRNDPHSEPLIACFDGQPFGYIETYWALEDRLGPYYDSKPFDHGFHLLVGEPEFLGGGRTHHLLNAVSHFLFLLDPRTDQLVGEPRSDNKNLLKWLEHTAWYKEKEFDFPHKHAALVKCHKAAFFETQL